MKQKIERQLRQIETDLSNSINQLHKPASEYTIKHLIRDKVLQVHKLGSQYACDFFGVKHFNTADDFAEMGKISDDVYRTWVYAKRPDAALIAMTSITLAKAIRSKARQIYSALIEGGDILLEVKTGSNPAVHVMTARMKQIEQFLPSGIEDVTAQPLIDPVVPAVVMMVWKTEEDSLVCPICEPLEGQTWELDDPSMLTPVEDTHPNCRCRLELQQQTPEEE